MKNGLEVGQVLTLFDPPCPNPLQQGPPPMVIRSTFGGVTNHPPNTFLSLPQGDLWPKNVSHSKNRQNLKSSIIHPRPIFPSKGTKGCSGISVWSILAK